METRVLKYLCEQSGTCILVEEGVAVEPSCGDELLMSDTRDTVMPRNAHLHEDMVTRQSELRVSA